MQDRYIVMQQHKKYWKNLFTSEDMESERNFWIYLSLQTLNISFVVRSLFFIEGIEGKIEIGVALCMGISLYSYAFFFARHKTLFQIVTSLQTHYDKHKDIPGDVAIIQQCHDEGNRMLRVYAVVMTLTGASFVIKPLLIFGLQLLRGDDAEVMLPFPAAYPWESKGVMLYVSFFLQSLLMMCGIAPSVAISGSTTVFFCLAIVSQLRLAQKRFLEVPEDREEEALGCLETALRSHQEALVLIKNVETVETVKLFCQIFGTAATLSMSLFRITCASAAEFEIIVPFVCLSLSVILQLGVLCYYGQKVIDEGDTLFERIYAVPWYKHPRAFKSHLVISLMRASKADRLTALSFADLSFETFNNVMTTAFSYVTFLQTISE